jgi:hypothetical protein
MTRYAILFACVLLAPTLATAKPKTKRPDQLTLEMARAKDFIETAIDGQARRSFSLYAKQAKTNGFGFQAHLLRTQGISELEDQILTVSAERNDFDERCRPEVLKLAQSRWDWSKRASEVNMQNQYEFLYRYTSRLLHATAGSVFTDQKNLELAEILVFLDYVYVTMLDSLELAETRIGIKPKLD